jgi:hypothetical protein
MNRKGFTSHILDVSRQKSDLLPEGLEKLQAEPVLY